MANSAVKDGITSSILRSIVNLSAHRRTYKSFNFANRLAIAGLRSSNTCLEGPRIALRTVLIVCSRKLKMRSS